MAMTEKRVPKAVLKAKSRLNGMVKIDTDNNSVVDYGRPGDPITAVTVSASVTTYEDHLAAYNRMKKDLDELQNNLLAEEKALGALSSRILSSARGKFGSDSNEVETLGGKRSSERKKPKSKGSANPQLTLLPEL